MHFLVEHRRKTGLRVVPRLDVQRLTRLEGYNGIGKSALIRLIQVCVGQHPYPDDETLWSSFREGIGQAAVHLSDIEGADMIEWALDADHWRADGEHVTNIGQMTIDGHSATLADVQELLAVHTILGNENLTKTLSRRLGVHRSAMAIATEPDSILRQRLNAIDEVLQPLANALERAGKLDLQDAVSRERQTQEELKVASSDEIAAQQRLSAVDEAVTLAAQLAEVEHRGDNLDTRIATLSKNISDIESDLERLDTLLTSASRSSAASEESRRELKKAQLQARRTERHERDALAEVERLATEAGLAVVTAIEINRERERTQEALDTAQNELASVHTAPAVADLADDLSTRLGHAEDAGLSEEILLQGLAVEATQTVSSLRVAFSKRSQQLRAVPPTDAVAELQARVDRHRDRLGILAQLAAAVRTHGDAGRKDDQARRRLTEAIERVATAADHDDVAELILRRRGLTTTLRDTAVERADLVRARNLLGGGATSSELASQLSKALARANLDQAELPAAHVSAVAAQQDAAGRVAALTSTHREAASRLREVRRGVSDVVELLVEDPRFAWVRSCASGLLPRLDSDADVQRTLIGQLHHVIEGLRGRIVELRQQMDAVNMALRVAQEALISGGGKSQGLVSSVRSWFSDEVSSWFNQPQLLDTVFENGRDVRVDLNDKTVHWWIDDTIVSRPLEAFSSGERAFAYTRAQLALLDGSPTPANRLIVLDEFGAFIAREWQHRLRLYLTDHAQRHPSDSIVLVLPLTRTEEELRSSARANDTLAQLRDLRYFTDTLVPRQDPQ